jgi:hypothetical protein
VIGLTGGDQRSKRRARAHGCGGAERTRRGAPAHGDGHPRRSRCKDIGSTAGAAFEEGFRAALRTRMPEELEGPKVSLAVVFGGLLATMNVASALFTLARV